jgi:subtilisin family serine protease
LVEECYWVAAAEYADSAGADIINSSLGYNTFDDPFFNHTPKDLCGNKTIVSKGASAAAAKGILVVNSAGNEGNNEWRLIGVPADAFNILTIGAVDDRLNWSSFSSIGNTADKRIKPDVSAQGEGVNVLSSEATIYKGDGTSYSCPIMAGALACIFQAVRPSSIPDLINCVRLCASRYYTPDKYLGYGIPDMILLLKMLGGDSDYSISKDVLLDARILDDKKLHVSILSNSKQKVKVNIADMRGNTLYAETISNIVKGANRIPLALKLKKLKPGMYSVYLTAKDGVSSEVFLIK